MTKTTTKTAEAEAKTATFNEEGRAMLKRGAAKTRQEAERAKAAALEATNTLESAYGASASELAKASRALVEYAFEDAERASSTFEKLVEAKDLGAAVRVQMDYLTAANAAYVARAGRYAEFMTVQLAKTVTGFQGQMSRAAKGLTPAAAQA